MCVSFDFLRRGGALLSSDLDHSAFVFATSVSHRAHENDRLGRQVLPDLWHPPGLDVVQRGVVRHRTRVANDDYVGAGVGQRTKPLVVLLPSCVHQRVAHRCAVHNPVRPVVVKHSRNVVIGNSFLASAGNNPTCNPATQTDSQSLKAYKR